ncbi:MAG: 23S rRNA (uracil(1939)-C(5))-methyltransferase RlmD [Candidatus Woesearchaeota archaeon]
MKKDAGENRKMEDANRSPEDIKTGSSDVKAAPRCSYFGRCGGCSAQHIAYGTQAENKRNMLARAAGLDSKDVLLFTGSPYNYRNRMDFIFHSRGLGLREKGKWHRIIDIKRCEIAGENINSLLKEVREWFSGADHFDMVRKEGTFRYAVIREGSRGSSVSFMLNDDSQGKEDALKKIRDFAAKTQADNVVAAYVHKDTDVSVSDNYQVIKGSDMLRADYLGRSFLYPVQGFFQNNHEMAEKLQEYCHRLLKGYDTSGARLLDLYSGVGTFGIMNADLFSRVTMVESVESCIKAAERNMKENSISNAECITLDAKRLKRLDLPHPLFVITDPPRSGMNPKTIEHLMSIKPEVMIYVSCNISQLGKDLKKFRDYSIKSAALFDMFPQTPHCEAVAELVRV